MNTYHIEITDTFGGDANYSWKKDYLVKAASFRGAVAKLARSHGGGWRKDWNTGDTARYNLSGACICAFISYLDDSAVSSFNGVAII